MSPAAIPSRVTSPARMSACNRDRLKSLSRRARKRSSRSPASSALTDTWKRLAVSCVVMILAFGADGLDRRLAQAPPRPPPYPPSTPEAAYCGADRPNARLIPAGLSLGHALGRHSCLPPPPHL